MHSFSLEHVNDMSTYRRRSFRVTKDLQLHNIARSATRAGAAHGPGRPSTIVSFTDLLLLFFRGLCVPFPARIVLVVVFWTVLWNSVGLFWGSAFLPCGFEATALFFEFVPCKIAKANLAFEWKN